MKKTFFEICKSGVFFVFFVFFFGGDCFVAMGVAGWGVREFCAEKDEVYRYTTLYGMNFSYVFFVSMSIISYHIKWIFAVILCNYFLEPHLLIIVCLR